MYSTAFLAAAFATATAVAAPVGNDAQADSIDKRSGHYAGYSGHRSPSKYGGVANTGKGTYYHGKYYNSYAQIPFFVLFDALTYSLLCLQHPPPLRRLGFIRLRRRRRQEEKEEEEIQVQVQERQGQEEEEEEAL